MAKKKTAKQGAIIGSSYTTKGFDYNGSWGGQFDLGGEIIKRIGAPSNGKYAKKTKPSAKNGLSYIGGPDPKKKTKPSSIKEELQKEFQHPMNEFVSDEMTFKNQKEYDTYFKNQALSKMTPEDLEGYSQSLKGEHPLDPDSYIAYKAPYVSYKDYMGAKNRVKGTAVPHGNVLGRLAGFENGGSIQDKGQLKKLNQLTNFTNNPDAKSGIHIKPSHKGLLHKNLGVPKGEKIPASKLKIKSTDSPAVKKRKQFAINAKKWKHEDGGEITPFSTVEDIKTRKAMLLHDRALEGKKKTKNKNIIDPFDGKLINQPSDESFVFGKDKYIDLVPYLDPKMSGEGMRNIPDSYKKALLNRYQELGGFTSKAEWGINTAPLMEASNASVQNMGQYIQPQNIQSGAGFSFGQNQTNIPNSGPTQGGGIMETLGGGMGILNTATNLIGGFQMLKQEKEAKRQAKQENKLSGLTRQVSSLDPERVKRKYVRPEDQIVDPNQLAPTYGVGTNYLKNGGKVKGNKTEIQNTYAPNTIYTQSGYEPLGESAANGAFMQGFNNIFGNIDQQRMGNLGAMAGSALGGGKGVPSGASTIGSTIGGVAGSFLGPVGGKVGELLGGAIGGFIGGKNAKQIENYQKGTQKNLMAAGFQDQTKGLQSQYTGFMEHGGNLTNPRVITTFGDHKLKDLLQWDPMMDTLRTGGNIRQNSNMDGDLQVYKGKAETISQNPYLPDSGETVMFKGPSHDEGGMPITFGKAPVEVEGGEPAVKLENGGEQGLTVFGNMKAPKHLLPEANGRKFKHYINDLSEKEARQNKISEKGLKLVNDTNVQDAFDKLKVSSGEAMLKGTSMKLKEIAEKKKNASIIQNAILETADEFGLDSAALAEGKHKKAKKGTFIPYGREGVNVDPRDWEEALKSKKLSRAQKDDFLKENPDWKEEKGKLVKRTSTPGDYKEVNIGEYKPGSADFQKAYANAKKAGLKEFNYKGKPIKVEDWSGKTTKVQTPGRTSEDWIDLYDPIDTTSLKGNLGKLDGKSLITPQRIPQTQEVVSQKSQGKGANWMDALNTVLPYLRPSNNLARPDLSPEMYAMASNQLEPVQAQLYHPLLQQVSDISLQDQMNANQADFNAIQRMVGNNPAALASLAGQKYAANTGVLGEQFRLNQAQKQGVYNANRQTLNDAQLKNLGILDQQYVRQSQAKSNTKATTQAALSSISDKIAKNKMENRMLDVYENTYNYRFGPNGYAYNLNPLAQFNMPQITGQTPVDENGNVIETRENTVKRDKKGMVQSTTQKDKTTKSYKNGAIVKSMKYL